MCSALNSNHKSALDCNHIILRKCGFKLRTDGLDTAVCFGMGLVCGLFSWQLFQNGLPFSFPGFFLLLFCILAKNVVFSGSDPSKPNPPQPLGLDKVGYMLLPAQIKSNIKNNKNKNYSCNTKHYFNNMAFQILSSFLENS